MKKNSYKLIQLSIWFYQKNKKAIPKFLSENDINKLLDYMQKNVKTFRDLQILVLTEILYASGLRVSELVQLKTSSLADDLTSPIY